jgi:outer membrane protein
MKKLALALALAFCLLFQNNVMAEGLSKVGIVDLSRCIKESNEGKRIAESLLKEKAARDERYNKAYNELATLKKEIEKQSLMLSTSAKEAKEAEYEKKTRALTYLDEDLTEEAQTSNTNANSNFLKTVNEVIQSMAKQQSFDLILEKSSSGILFTSDALDVTDLLIKELNKAKP